MMLSKTQLEMYKECPRKYQLRYIEKWVSKIQDSPLFFGIAIDEALNCMLVTKKIQLNDEELQYVGKSAKDLFVEKLQNVVVLKENVDIRCSELARYSMSDFDKDLLSIDDVKYIIKNHNVSEIKLTMNDWEDFVDTCVSVRKNKEMLNLPEYRLFNFFCWMSLKNKGLMLIDAYEKEIMPEIVEVHEIQKTIALPNDDGDHIKGVIDFIATFKDGVTRIMDNKTSSVKYTQKNIDESLQLSIYTEHEQNFEAGFAVLEKKIRKREPRVRTELVFGKVSSEQIDAHFEEVDLVLSDIKSELFHQNTNSCFSYGKPCPYKSICDSNNYDGLVCTKKENK